MTSTFKVAMASAGSVRLRQANAKPIFDELEVWLHAQLPSISVKSPLAGAIRYALTRMARKHPAKPQLTFNPGPISTA